MKYLSILGIAILSALSSCKTSDLNFNKFRETVLKLEVLTPLAIERVPASQLFQPDDIIQYDPDGLIRLTCIQNSVFNLNVNEILKDVSFEKSSSKFSIDRLTVTGVGDFNYYASFLNSRVMMNNASKGLVFRLNKVKHNAYVTPPGFASINMTPRKTQMMLKNTIEILENEEKFNEVVGVKRLDCAQWILGLNFGIAGSIRESTKIKPLQSPIVRMDIKYMLKPNLGIMVLGGYSMIATNSVIETKSHYVNATLEGVYKLSSLFNLKNTDFSLFVHAGPGVGSMWNKGFKNRNATDPYLKNHDDVINLNLGITPQYALTQKVLLNMDFSYAYNLKQDHYFDYTTSFLNSKVMMYNASIGLVFKLNEVKLNASEKTQTTLKNTIEILPKEEKYMEVAGVKNILDTLQNHSPKNSDTLVENTFYMIPDALESNQDLDSVQSNLAIATVKADVDANQTAANAALDSIAGQKKAKMVKMLALIILFDFDKFDLKYQSKLELEKLIDFMLVNADINIEMCGYTDNIGSDRYNLTLSQKRAKSVFNYLTSNGVISSRLIYRGYGKINSIDSNSSQEERAHCRRVEFKVTK
jgi:outer membrane protein OmpA-like peptidoglycan-associated protein